MSNNQQDSCNCTPEVPSEKLHVLALHGYRQNAEVFRQKTGSFRKLLHKWVKFTYITAPHKVVLVDNLENINMDESHDEEQYGWFFNRDNMTYRGIRKGGPAIGYEESVKLIEQTFEKYGPFDGIMGFSQGACFLGLLCDLQQRGMLKAKFNFAILISGFKSNCLSHLKYYGDPINLPSLHVFGETDLVIPTDMSRELRDAFDSSPVTVNHEGGHYVPASSAQKHEYQRFIKAMYFQKQAQNKLQQEATTR